MNENSLKKALTKINLGALRYFDSIGSTNDEALAWAADDAKDLSIVIADEQTQGRGRLNRKWFTPKGSGLAFSLILRTTLRPHLSRTVGLAALSIADALLKHGLSAQIKWPNDILLNERKLAGILVESVWSGEDMDTAVIGMGINVMKEAVPPFHLLQFPAISLGEVLGKPPDRERFLHDILAAFITRLPQIGSDELIKEWEEKLAFRGQRVQIINELEQKTKQSTMNTVTGKLLGLEPDGSLRLRSEHGNLVTVHFGDVSLRPSADTI